MSTREKKIQSLKTVMAITLPKAIKYNANATIARNESYEQTGTRPYFDHAVSFGSGDYIP